MTLTEFIKKYGETAVLNAEAEKKLCEALGIEYKAPESVWDLEEGDKYWRLNSDGCIMAFHWEGPEYDEEDRDQGNVFLTKEEARAEKECRAVETLLLKHGGRRAWKPDEHNLILKRDGQTLFPSYISYPVVGGIYFGDVTEAGHAIEKIGEDRIKKALFQEMEE